VNAARTALVAVDLSRDALDPGGWAEVVGAATPGSEELVGRLAARLPGLRSAGTPIAWVNWDVTGCEVPDPLREAFAATGLGLGAPLPRGHHAFGGWGAAVTAALPADPDGPDEAVFGKTRLDAFHGTGLDAWLRARRVDTVLLAGMQAEQCVLATAFAASALGYRVVLVEDCLASADPEALGVVTRIARTCFSGTLEEVAP
jgi:ureidoacrylate peracid hydrolase